MIWVSPFCDRSKWHDRFAYLPLRMDNGSWIWWENYRARYVDIGHMWTEMEWQRHLTKAQDW